MLRALSAIPAWATVIVFGHSLGGVVSHTPLDFEVGGGAVGMGGRHAWIELQREAVGVDSVRVLLGLEALVAWCGAK